MTEKSLEDFFGQIGSVKNIIMLRDKLTGLHKGFAYVEMTELESIPNCLLFNNVVPDFQKFPILVKASEAEKNFLFKKVILFFFNFNTSTCNLYSLYVCTAYTYCTLLNECPLKQQRQHLLKPILLGSL